MAPAGAAGWETVTTTEDETIDPAMGSRPQPAGTRKACGENFVMAAMGPKQTLAAFYECTVHQSGHLTFSGVRVA